MTALAQRNRTPAAAATATELSAMSTSLVTTPRVTQMIGVADILFGIAVAAVVLSLGRPWWQVAPYVLLVVLTGTAMLVLPAPHPSSRPARWHVLPSVFKPALACIALLPDPAAGVPVICATTVYIAFRLQGPRVIASYLLGSVLLLGLVALVRFDLPMALAAGISVPVTAGVGFAVAWVMARVELLARALDAAVANDPLTGVGNRRTLDETLAHEVERHGRSGLPFSVLSLDLNGFKELNDRDGHPAGDALLTKVAVALRDCVRAGDSVTRPGGDEFCIVLPGADTDEHPELIAHIRRGLASVPMGDGFLSAGIGAAAFPADGRSAAALLAVADQRLYADKTGRRRP